MPRELFARPSEDPQPQRSTRLLPLSIALHVVLVSSAVIVPLFAVGDLPDVASRRTVAVLATIPRPEIVVKLRPRGGSPAPPPSVRKHTVPGPVEAPDRLPPADVVVTPGMPSGLSVTSDFATAHTVGGPGIAGPPAAGTPAPPSGPVRPGGDIEPPRKIRHVTPEYPAIARQARVEGTVVIDAIIGPDGQVRDATVRESKPLLDRAALAAVRQWLYTPTRLNNVPVAVIMTVEVRFTLGR